MEIGKLQVAPEAPALTRATSDSGQASPSVGAHSTIVEPIAGGYRAYVTPSVPGAHASGVSVRDAEANLTYVLDLLA